CAQGIEKTLRKNPATADVFVSLEDRLVAVATKEGQNIPDEELKKALTAFGALLASSTTLVCCVLPAALVSLGAGAALVGLVTAVPQLIWLSEHKALVFGTAAALLVISGIVLWQAR